MSGDHFQLFHGDNDISRQHYDDQRMHVQAAQREQQQRHRRLYDQALTRSRSAPDGQLDRTNDYSNTTLFHHQHNHYHSPSFAPPLSRGSLVALLREQQRSMIEPDKMLLGGRRSIDDDDTEISSLLARSHSDSDGTSSPMQSHQNHAMEDAATASYTSSPARPAAPVATRQQKARAAKATAATSVRLTTTSAASASGFAVAAAAGKRSRYLREVDRRSIIHRIDRGEKQAALAKEFGVTRAAICHINKNRVEILTRSTRADVHSGARHPKRGLYTTSASSQFKAGESYENQPSVFEVRSQAMAVLMTTLRKRETPSREFQVCTDRAFRLLLEEALSRVAMKVIEIVTPNDFVCEGVCTVKSSCGVSISEDGFALLQVFRSIQPTSPSGYITLNATAIHEGVSSEPTLQKVCVPPDLRTYDVFLMEATCATGVGACVAIQALLDFGAQEGSIHFVCLLASAFAVSEICSRYPAVHVVTGAVDPEVSDADALCPGFGNFSERYYNATVVHHTSVGANADL